MRAHLPSIVGAVLAGLLLGSCGSGPPAPADPAPPGWRWESYRGVELQVPADWGHQGSGRPSNPAWCVGAEGGPSPEPSVNRSEGAVMAAIMCPRGRPADTYAPSVELLPAGRDPVGEVDVPDGWTSETAEVAGVVVRVTDADPDRLATILGSVRKSGDVDANGCRVLEPAAADGARPSTAPLPPADVTAASVCRYGSGDDPGDDRNEQLLLASSVLSEADARTLADAFAAAPEGPGPDASGGCSDPLGDEVVVVTLAAAEVTSQVVVRYAGCEGFGTDDGAVARELTGDVVRTVLTGPHRPGGVSGVVGDLLWP